MLPPTPPTPPSTGGTAPANGPQNVFLQLNRLEASIEALLARETAVTQSELAKFVAGLRTALQQIMEEMTGQTNLVKGKLQSLERFSEANLAKQLTTFMSKEMPTPAGLTQAGEQVAGQIRQAGAEAARHIKVSVDDISRQVAALVQESLRQVGGASDTFRKAAADAPRTYSIDFLRSWKQVAAVAGVGLVVGLVLTWFPYAVFGGFAQVSREEHWQLQTQYRQLQHNDSIRQSMLVDFWGGRQRLAAAQPALAHEYFPYKSDRVPAAKPARRPAGKRRR